MANRPDPDNSQDQEIATEGYRRALAMLVARCTPDRLVVLPTEGHDCRRIWGRDGSAVALAGVAPWLGAGYPGRPPPLIGNLPSLLHTKEATR